MAESDQRKVQESNFSLDDSLRWGNRLFFGLFKPLLVCLGSLFAIRVLFFFTARVFFSQADPWDLLWAFLTGMRFDLLVLGYLMIPVTVVLLLCSWLRLWAVFMWPLIKIFLAVAWLAVCALSLVDLPFFAEKGRHWSLYDFRSSGFSPLEALGPGHLIAAIILAGFAVMGAWSFWTLPAPRFLMSGYKENPWRRVLRTLGPIFLVALASRGTVTAHHLEKAHTEVSTHQKVNQLVMNSPWAFDKKPQDD